MVKFFAYLILVFAAACTSPWADVKHPLGQGWLYADSLQVPFAVQDTLQKARITVGIEVNDDYAYNNLYMLFTVKTPTGAEQQSRVQLVLADSAGNWYANRQLNGTYYMRTVLNPQARFSQTGRYTLGLKHYMRPDTVQGITQVQIRVEAAN